MRLFALLVTLLLASGASAQSEADLLKALMIEAELAAMEIGMSTAVEATVSTYYGVTNTETVDLEAGVEYMIAVQVMPDSEIDPDFWVEDSDLFMETADEEADDSEILRFTAETSGPHLINVELYGCDSSECLYAFAVFAKQ